MNVATKIIGMFEALKVEDVQALPPAQRERFSFLCSRWCALARTHPARETKTGGVLADLKNGDRVP